MTLQLDPKVETLIRINLTKLTIGLQLINNVKPANKIQSIALYGAKLKIELGSRLPAEVAKAETANRLSIGTWDDCVFKPNGNDNGQ